ncbi:MAG: NADPH-dependent 7-cyano-7-deazaguanine reductase QueF, partial [Lysobacterales bacterium]
MSIAAHSPLGKPVAYASRYDPGLLFPIARAPNRAALGLGDALPFHGVDIWNAYELAWLDARGKPAIALAEFRIPATSPNMIESKSFKLYLNSYTQERIADAQTLRERLVRDLSAATGADIAVALTLPQRFAELRFAPIAGMSIDEA